MGLKPNP